MKARQAKSGKQTTNKRHMNKPSTQQRRVRHVQATGQMTKPRQKNKARHQRTPKKQQRSMIAANKSFILGKQIGSLIWQGLFYIITIGLIGTSIFYLFHKDEDGSLFGYRMYSVLTNSMAQVDPRQHGGFYAGDLIMVRRASYASLTPGDIVTYRLDSKGNQLTHRIVKKMDTLDGTTGEFLVTKGDANHSTDPPVSYDRVLGRVVLVLPKAGYILTFMQEHWGVTLLVLGGVMAASYLIAFIRQRHEGANQEIKRSKRRERSGSGKARSRPREQGPKDGRDQTGRTNRQIAGTKRRVAKPQQHLHLRENREVAAASKSRTNQAMAAAKKAKRTTASAGKAPVKQRKRAAYASPSASSSVKDSDRKRGGRGLAAASVSAKSNIPHRGGRPLRSQYTTSQPQNQRGRSDQCTVQRVHTQSSSERKGKVLRAKEQSKRKGQKQTKQRASALPR